MAYGVLGGLLAGLAIIYFVNRLDDKIDSPLELQENIDFPIIGQIPLQRTDKSTKRVPLLTEGDQRRGYLEHHRSIRSAILFRSTEASRPRSLMICSAAPGEGKSSLAANLAFVFAHSGARTLLIDADLRRGLQHTLFNLPISPGLADYLLGRFSWRDVVHTTQLTNLDVILRGKVPHRAGDLFLHSEIDQLIEESRAEYDMVLWDTVPLLAANDAANLCSRIEGVLFVARVRYSTTNSVHTALDELSKRNAKILGVVLNAVEPNQPGYHDKYRYEEYFDAELTA
jgi:capsular exopolysaccharide synthesis family protein